MSYTCIDATQAAQALSDRLSGGVRRGAYVWHTM